MGAKQLTPLTTFSACSDAVRKKIRVRRLNRRASLERLERRELLASDWQNNFVRCDINGDGIVVPLDVLVAINELNDPQYVDPSGNLPSRGEHPDAPYYDTSGDGKFVPIDVLRIINALNGDRTGPTIEIRLGNDTAPGGSTNGDRITSDGTIAGRVVDDLTGISKATIQIDDDLAVDVALHRDGTFEFPANLTDGEHTARLLARDGTGHETTHDGLEFTIDATPPEVPGLVVVYGINTRLVEGAAETGSIYTLFVDGEPFATHVADGIVRVILNSLPDGSYDLTATATDAAGNVSPVSQTVTYTYFQPVIPPPDRLILNPESDTGSSNSDGITSDTTPTFTVFGGFDEIILFVDGHPVATRIASETGVQITVAELGEGPHEIIARSRSLIHDILSVEYVSINIVIDTSE